MSDLDESRAYFVAPVARWEILLLSALCTLALVYWAVHFHPFVLPASDYASFERIAQELWAGEAPGGYKRMPMFPLLFGGAAQFVPGEDAFLHAALGLNIALSIATLVVAYALGRRLIGPAAFVPVVALLYAITYHDAALQPLVEPTLGFLVLLSLYLFTLGSRWQYLAAGLAAVTRYEASALILIFFVLNSLETRRPCFRRARGVLFLSRTSL